MSKKGQAPPVEQTLTKSFVVRVAPDEFRRWQSKAQSHRMPVAEWVRSRCGETKQAVSSETALQQAIVAMLFRHGMPMVRFGTHPHMMQAFYGNQGFWITAESVTPELLDTPGSTTQSCKAAFGNLLALNFLRKGYVINPGVSGNKDELLVYVYDPCRAGVPGWDDYKCLVCDGEGLIVPRAPRSADDPSEESLAAVRRVLGEAPTPKPKKGDPEPRAYVCSSCRGIGLDFDKVKAMDEKMQENIWRWIRREV